MVRTAWTSGNLILCRNNCSAKDMNKTAMQNPMNIIFCNGGAVEYTCQQRKWEQQPLIDYSPPPVTHLCATVLDVFVPISPEKFDKRYFLRKSLKVEIKLVKMLKD
jgi:hypothetical protein